MATKDHPTRVTIVLDTDDASPELVYLWAASRTIALVTALRAEGVCVYIVSIDVEGARSYRW